MSVVKDILSVSSGTISQIMGLRDYEDIDKAQALLAVWAGEMVEQEVLKANATWMEAWELFRQMNHETQEIS